MDIAELTHVNDLLNAESDIRNRIKDHTTALDKQTRTLVGALNRIHTTPSGSRPLLLESVRPLIAKCHPILAALAEVVPHEQFWRYKDMWTFSLRNAIFAALLVRFLSDHSLASLEDVSSTLAIRDEWSSRFTVAVEDYLHGLISVVNELSRLAVNTVTMGDYEEPLKISIFVKDVFAGFSMLNLKNDTLRRRFDSLKYDIKKVEEVVYDISLRSLGNTKGSGPVTGVELGEVASEGPLGV